ncbi:mitochondrial carrier [Rhizoclosmatium globosum]|uniref:Mitochondrial carrier n=1 Tax=Rhizoclosmatium globosum TaxID=329046 RepID=A0A1Y2CNC8_9FUNG|nr:mitochondrial carrier [Rhizoclosmatium globosum]|eukprot:ORY48446.1 mitochondrial carrier [Rhizoclosmatium globosum]
MTGSMAALTPIPVPTVTSKPAPLKSQWWFGGLASSIACIFTHPLALYKGLDASMLRQLTYSSARFGVYETAKQRIEKTQFGKEYPTGSPADLANVRLQSDARLPPAQQRYSNALDALATIFRKEGITKLWTGVGPNILRAIPMTAGQAATYDSVKSLLLSYPAYFSDNLTLYIIASTAGALVATTVCAPIDVINTDTMLYKGSWDAATKIAKKEGLGAFLKGWTPAFVRLAPHTVLTFLFLEQIKRVYNGV